MGGRPLENPEGLAGSLGETQIVWLKAQGKPTMFGWGNWGNTAAIPECVTSTAVHTQGLDDPPGNRHPQGPREKAPLVPGVLLS